MPAGPARGRSRTAAGARRPAGPTCTSTIDTDGRTGDRRGDFDEVYGDWAEVGEHGPTPPRGPAAAPAAGAARLRRRRRRAGAARCAAERDPARGSPRRRGARAGAADARRRRRWTRCAALADDLRRDAVGDDVTYVVNRNINFTNVCYTGCRFCAFAQRRTDADAYTLSLDAGRRPGRRRRGTPARPRSACRAASTPTCPAPPTSTSPREVKRALPGACTCTRSRPMEVVNGAARTGAVDPGVAGRGHGGRARLASPAPPRRSSTTTSAGCSPRASCPTAAWIEVITHRARAGHPDHARR